MVVPLLAAKGAAEGLKALKTGLQTPIIGRKVTTVKTTSKGIVTTEDSFQVRAWEIALAALVTVGVVAVASGELGPVEKEAQNPIFTFIAPLRLFS